MARPAPSARALAFTLLAIFFLLRYDLWSWGGGFVLGLPPVLAYHLAYSLAAVAVLGLLVKLAWPDHLQDGAEDGP